MKILSDIFLITRRFDDSKLRLFNYTLDRGLKITSKIKWVRPQKLPFQHSVNTGDLSPLDPLSKDELKLGFKDCPEMLNANDSVKKVFSLDYQYSPFKYQVYKKKLVDLVRRHEWDETSPEVVIAKMTAKIRFYQPVLDILPRNPRIAASITTLIGARKKRLQWLREYDYRRFEWVLEKLNLKYSHPILGAHKVTRKSSLRLLAKLKTEQEKENRLAAYREELDKAKVPFLERKLEKLKEILETQKKYNLPQTVTENDIKECMEKLESTKIQVAENQKYGYKMKIHPFTFEKYYEKRLIEKENS